MNFDPIEVVVEQTVRTFAIRDWTWQIEDFVEDLAEGLKLIGAAKIFEDCIHTAVVASNMIKLPTGIQNIIEVYPKEYAYKEAPGFLVVDAQDGVEMAITYQGMPLDARGYPVVPDNAPTRQALMWWLARVLILQGHVKTVSFEFAEREWQWRCGSARADLNVQSVGQWNKFANDYARLNPHKDQYEKNFVDLGRPNTLDREKIRLGRFRDYRGDNVVNSEQKPE